MTHSGGKPHAVGDRGQRYEVTVFDKGKNERIVFGWSESESGAKQMAAAAELSPRWSDATYRDRQAKP